MTLTSLMLVTFYDHDHVVDVVRPHSLGISQGHLSTRCPTTNISQYIAVDPQTLLIIFQLQCNALQACPTTWWPLIV